MIFTFSCKSNLYSHRRTHISNQLQDKLKTALNVKTFKSLQVSQMWEVSPCSAMHSPWQNAWLSCNGHQCTAMPPSSLCAVQHCSIFCTYHEQFLRIIISCAIVERTIWNSVLRTICMNKTGLLPWASPGRLPHTLLMRRMTPTL